MTRDEIAMIIDRLERMEEKTDDGFRDVRQDIKSLNERMTSMEAKFESHQMRCPALQSEVATKVIMRKTKRFGIVLGVISGLVSVFYAFAKFMGMK